MQIPRFARDDNPLMMAGAIIVYVAIGVVAQAQQAPTDTPHLTTLKLCSEKGSDPATCVLKPPRARRSPMPQYTHEAQREGIQGIVVLRLVVGTDGRTHDIALVRSLGYGLDEKAMDAVKKWRFHPAIAHDGKPVAAPVTIEITFQAPAPEPR